MNNENKKTGLRITELRDGWNKCTTGFQRDQYRKELFGEHVLFEGRVKDVTPSGLIVLYYAPRLKYVEVYLTTDDLDVLLSLNRGDYINGRGTLANMMTKRCFERWSDTVRLHVFIRIDNLITNW